MTSAVQCIIILACTATLTSSAAILQCRCLKTGKVGRIPLKNIVSTTEYSPRPYCNKKEVIITLISGRTVCLNPTESKTIEVVQTVKAREAAKNSTASKATTAAETQTATVSETATVSASSTIAPTSS